MPARAIWKGVIRFEQVRVPVKFYSAVQDRDVHFHLLHDQDMVRLRQQMVNPRTGEAVPRDRIRRGYEIDRGLFVLLDNQELQSIEPPASRDVEVTRFLDPAQINHLWYLRPYWLGPDGDDDAYFALATALAREGKEGLARWVMRKKQYVGALRAEGDYLMMTTLRHAGEVIPSTQLGTPEGRELVEKEQRMAEQLVAALESEFQPDQYKNTYRERVMQLIEAKREGRTIEPEEYEEKPEVESLAESLRASLERVK